MYTNYTSHSFLYILECDLVMLVRCVDIIYTSCILIFCSYESERRYQCTAVCMHWGNSDAWSGLTHLGLSSLSGTARYHLNCFNRSIIWRAHRQKCCWDVCQISERNGRYNIQYRRLDTSRDLAVRRPSSQWVDSLNCIALNDDIMLRYLYY